MKKKIVRMVLTTACAATVLSQPAYAAGTGARQAADPSIQETEQDGAAMDDPESEIQDQETGEFEDGIDDMAEEAGNLAADMESSGDPESAAAEAGEEESIGNQGETETETEPETTAAASPTIPAAVVDGNTTDDTSGGLEVIETPSYLDEDGNVTVTVSVAEDVVLPITMTLKQGTDTFNMTVSRNGQQIKIKPGNYRATDYTDGNGRRKRLGATLRISDEGGELQLNLKNPNDDTLEKAKGLITANFFFIPIGIILILAYRGYKKYYA